MIRNSLLTLAFCALLVNGIGCAIVGRNVMEKPTEEYETRIYEVFGMDCPGCQGGLNKLVKKIPAVQDSEANWEEKQLVVRVRPKAQLNDEDIYDAIRRANFTPGKRLE